MKYSPRLSNKQKVHLIKDYFDGKSITLIASENGISRTIFYRWIKQYSTQNSHLVKSLTAKNPRGSKHWRKILKPTENKVISISLKNPKFSIREIAAKTRLSVGSVWKILRNNSLDSQDKRREYLKKNGVHIYKLASSEQKIKMLELYEKGDKIAKICRDAGVSRTIFYRWMKNYNLSGSNSEALNNKRPAGQRHWRFKPGFTEQILKIVRKNPKLSLSEIFFEARERDLSISRSGLYYMLKRMELNTYETRLAYASSGGLLGMNHPRLPSSRSTNQLGYFNYLPRFMILCLISFICGSIMFYSTPYLPQVIKFINPENVIRNIENKIAGVNPQGKKIPTQGKATAPGNATGYSEPTHSTQNLSTGALSINTQKDVYSPDEDIQIGLGIVDHLGQTVCRADLILEIANSTGTPVAKMSSSDYGIRRSGKCALQSVTNTPDYVANVLPLGKSGTYRLHVLAETYEGRQEYNSKLIISDKLQPFEIVRTSYPSRVFPESSYPVEITVKANRDFEGEISDNLPKGISASKISNSGVLFKDQRGKDRIIRWKAKLNKGEIYKISYNLHFPQVWPEFYEIGPIKMSDKTTGKIVFQENRFWQIAADAL